MRTATLLLGAAGTAALGLALMTFDRTDRAAPARDSTPTLVAPSAVTAPQAAAVETGSDSVAPPRDPGMPYRFEVLGVTARAGANGAPPEDLAWIAVDGEPARLVALNAELRPGIRLREITARHVRIANDDSTMVWDLSVPPPAGAAVTGPDPASSISASAQVEMQAAGYDGTLPPTNYESLPTAGAGGNDAQATMLRAQSGESPP